MAAFTNLFENRLVDGLFRSSPTAWAASTAYVVGQMVYSQTANGYGKIMEVSAISGTGTSGGTEPTWPAVATTPNTVVDNAGANQITWTVYAVGVPKRPLWVALFTATPSDTGGGTEVTGGSYARVNVANTNAAWARTNAAADTSAVSTGTTGTTSNNGIITFPAPTADWGSCTHMGIFDAPTGGNLLMYVALTAAKTVNNGDPAPTFPAAALTVQVDN